ncbi:hypothetical protein EGQ50_02265 [Coxiella endosymbiont of Amblyomma sculptum]|nr:hypothetical protein EGQ50_02265 [Coxiella endosymbiont of Amblyomma sculptum]
MCASMSALGCVLLGFVLPVGFIASLVLGLITLQKGYKASLSVLSFILLPAIALAITQHFGFFYRFDLLLAQCGLMFVLALILRHTVSWKRVLESASLIGILLVSLIHLVFPNIRKIWVELIKGYFLTNDWMLTFHLDTNHSAEIIRSLATIATGSFVFFVLFGIIVLLVLARWWQTALFFPGRFRLEFTEIRMDQTSAMLLIIVTIGLFWQSSWLEDIYPTLLLPFMIGGLSLLHRLAINRKEMLLLIITIYIALLLLTFFTTVVLAIVGLMDSFCNFRKRYVLFQN